MSTLAPAVTLADSEVSVVVHPGSGMLVTSFTHLASGPEGIWTSGEPVPARSELGPGGTASTGTFLADFVGGWFPMIPTVGFPAADDGSRHLHGTALRSSWAVVDRTPTSLRAEVVLDSTLAVTRILTVADGALLTRTRITNGSDRPVPVTHGEHPCLRLAAFADLLCEPSVASVPHPALEPGLASLSSPQDLAWPVGRSTSGAIVDVAGIGRTDWIGQDHVMLDLPVGGVQLVTRDGALSMTMTWDPEVWPHALIWRRQDSLMPGVVAIEPASVPGRDAAEQPSSPLLAPGESIDSFLTLAWRSGDPTTAEGRS